MLLNPIQEHVHKRLFNCLIRFHGVLKKALLFLSFYKVQNKHKGVALHAFFLFFPTKDPCQLRSTSLIEGITHRTSNKAKINYHSMTVLEQ